jgi:hypothetical protein
VRLPELFDAAAVEEMRQLLTDGRDRPAAGLRPRRQGDEHRRQQYGAKLKR